MDYMSKGVKRLLLVLVAVLVVLASPNFLGAAWGQTMRGFGVPDAWSVFAMIGLVLLPLALGAGWAGHKIAFAIFGDKKVVQLFRKPGA